MMNKISRTFSVNRGTSAFLFGLFNSSFRQSQFQKNVVEVRCSYRAILRDYFVSLSIVVLFLALLTFLPTFPEIMTLKVELLAAAFLSSILFSLSYILGRRYQVIGDRLSIVNWRGTEVSKMPLNKVRQVLLERGPLEALFGLCHLRLVGDGEDLKLFSLDKECAAGVMQLVQLRMKSEVTYRF